MYTHIRKGRVIINTSFLYTYRSLFDDVMETLCAVVCYGFPTGGVALVDAASTSVDVTNVTQAVIFWTRVCLEASGLRSEPL